MNAIITEINNLWPMLSVVTTVCSVLAAVFAGYFLYHLRKHFVSRAEHEEQCERHEALAAAAAEHDKRLDTLERRMEAVPTKEDLHSIQLSLEGVRGDQKAFSAKIDGMNDTLGIVQRNMEMLVQSHIGE